MGNYVGSLATELKKTVKPLSGTKVASEEETKERKTKFLSILDKATDEFVARLEQGSIVISSMADLEKIIKLTLLASGEANNIVSESTETKESTSFDALNMNIDNIAQLLDSNDPDVKAVYDKLFNSYNDANDAATK